jgi:hypothetical protein
LPGKNEDVPWSPTSACLPDARLDPYRNRVAELLRGDQVVGHALILTEYVGRALGGHLWWTRWGPYQGIPSISIALSDGSRLDDYWVHPPDVSNELDTELDQWARNEMPLLGELLTTRWLEPAQSLEVARDRFGVQDFDEKGRAVWEPAEPVRALGWNEREEAAGRRDHAELDDGADGAVGTAALIERQCPM